MDARFMVLGFTASGKTTFAAALWHLLDSREVPTALQKGRHSGDFSYLEEIAQGWSEGWQLGRTRSGQIEEIKINLLHAPTSSELVVEFNDLSGETFETAFANRICSPDFVDMVKRANGIVLFVSSDRLVDSVTILDVLPPEDDTSEPAVEDERWDASKTPLQVRLVDLLQSLRHPPFSKSPLKVAVIVSAWDIAKKFETDAGRWLAARYPLLDQFLKTNEGVADVRVYGVSAQGGKLSNKGDSDPEAERDRLLSIMPPSKRIEIVGPEVAEHDLSRPLLWLAGLEAPIG